jgi:hypothetical protein
MDERDKKMKSAKELVLARFVHNGLPDGYMVRLASLEERHFGTATKIEEKKDCLASAGTGEGVLPLR